MKRFYFGLLEETDFVGLPFEAVISSHIGRIAVTVEENAEEFLRKKYGEYLYSTKEERIEKVVHDLLIEKKKTLVLAESCTGGALAAKLTAIPDASLYFLGSLVTYSNGMKEKVLGISKKILQSHGAVSEEVAIAMAKGAKQISGADLSVAITGIVGPSGGTKEKPVGTVYASIGEEAFLLPKIKQKTRDALIEYTCTYLLFTLWKKLCNMSS